MKKILKVILNILTCLSLFFGLLIVAVVGNNKTPINSMEGLYFGLNAIWVFLLFLPIPISNIIYSLYLKKSNHKYKSNLILGIVFSVLLTGYSSMYFLSRVSYNEDKNYLFDLEQKIGVDLPNEFTIITQDWTQGEQTSSYDIYLKHVSVVRFENNIDLSFVNGWISNIEKQKDNVPSIFYHESINYDKFLIYCFDTKESNPNNFNCDYEYVVLGYDYDNNNLLIYEYYFN